MALGIEMAVNWVGMKSNEDEALELFLTQFALKISHCCHEVAQITETCHVSQ